MQILNPLTNTLFLPLFGTFAGMLSVALLGVLWGIRVTKDAVLKKELLRRWLSWAGIAAVTVTALLSGTIVFAVLTSVISVVCTSEYCKMSKRASAERVILLVCAALMPLVAVLAQPSLLGFAAISSVLLAIVSIGKAVRHRSACAQPGSAGSLPASSAIQVAQSRQAVGAPRLYYHQPVCLLLDQPNEQAIHLRKANGFGSALVSLLALFYVPVLASHAVLLYCISGPALLISIISASALANVLAFVFGKLLGGPKLAPNISPNKTWSGVAGSVAGAYLGFFLLSTATHLQLPQSTALTLPLVVAVSGVLGDLFESFLKRSFHVKDAGAWLPGFGGALDRVDGLLFILPCVFYLLAPIV